MEYDVIVAGAGPAGSTTARYCALYGLKTLLLDKAAFPRDKPCGGGITVRCMNLLEDIPKHIKEKECNTIRMHYKKNNFEKTYDKTLVTTVERVNLDKHLLDKAASAGADVIPKSKVEGFFASSNRVEVEASGGTYSASVLVGADGVNSKISRLLGNRQSQSRYILTCEAEISASPGMLQKQGDAIDFYFDAVSYGYGWVFPKKKCLNVGVGCLLGEGQKIKKSFDTLIRRIGLPNLTPPKYALIPYGDFNKKIVADNTLLVGDAAGFGEPLTGEGLYYAVRSGKLAAETIASASEKHDFTQRTLQAYEGKCRSAFSGDFRRARIVVENLGRHPDVGYKMIVKNEPVVDKFVNIQFGDGTYLDFRNWFIPHAPALLINSLLLK
ncbi:MAG TPA: geranylgeranyl reductase family protein [Candidatus Altiarchaeales archaeon]|nr:geranylgeranyl reductase family protein [Candidatus Altiarchaeales archaeon]